MPLPLLPRLRRETAQAHARLEATVLIEDCIKDLDCYRELLKQFLGYYQPLETALENVSGWEDWDIDLSQRRKAPWIQHDLSALGLSPEEIRHLPRCPPSLLPETRSLAQAFGCAYVLEGSTLGGRHISVMLDGSPVPPGARRFFLSHGAQVLPMWKAFCSAMENFNLNASTSQTDELIGAANQTFAHLQRWMDRDRDRD
ncbi:biliverdin-producing heme oxygenase [Phragmitibacter flavus]|uniref:Biliverdin-producing heme oxygenase n=1 Tax=Phragmitibacter flavus TaxID=2576071 RepID=A0A5R8K7K8_9BACT|nr:biliverdin-producing heme oxygenase [Phragmitibacter flavus]TLD68336.1 biliverdin-producing heme oxygenase [Phragmitibacter flavus]